MARRGRKPKINSGIPSAAVTLADASAAFIALDTSWVDQLEDDQDQIAPTDQFGLEPDPESAPEPDPEPEAAISVRPVTDCDVDRLWDWVRRDEDRGLEFLGFQPKTAREVYGHFAQNFTDNPVAAAFAIDELGTHIGFALFNPIHPIPFQAVTHLYLAASVRGRLGEIVQQLLRICDDRYHGLSLVIVTPDERRMRLCRRAGFTVSYVLTRPAGGT